ncbi:MAG: hypothetical protein ABH952_01420 [Candidatus Omnitrophota bacterium]
MKDAYLKILDVNFDRAKEGMRVAEEILRFIICDKPLTLTAKNIRHKLTAVFKQFKITEFSLSYARNVNKDFGQRAIFLEKKKRFDRCLFK